MFRYTIAIFCALLASGQTGTPEDAWLKPWLGTWHLSLEKSKYSPNSVVPRREVFVLELWKAGLKLTISGETAEGKPRHDECLLRYDGTEYACNAAIPTQTV